jgi:hypothetical protein
MMEAVPSYRKLFMGRITVPYPLIRFRPRTIVQLDLRPVLLKRKHKTPKMFDSNPRLPQSVISSTSLS